MFGWKTVHNTYKEIFIYVSFFNNLNILPKLYFCVRCVIFVRM